MSLPHLLLVDDSEAILAYEKAALSGHYTLSTALNGRDALVKVYQVKPAAVLLDLSMPEMDGDEVLIRMKADPEVARIPVIVISSEKARAEACLRNGAAAYLPKPIRAEELLALVARTLENSRLEERKGNMAVLFLGAGPLEVAVPLESVRSVLLQPETLTLPAGTSYLSEVFELHGQPVCVLDLAYRLGVEHEEELSERKLVVVQQGETLIGLCVDRVRDPEEFGAQEITLRSELGGSNEQPLGDALVAVIASARGTVPVIDPRALLSRGLLRKLPGVVKQMQQQRLAEQKQPAKAVPVAAASAPTPPTKTVPTPAPAARTAPAPAAAARPAATMPSSPTASQAASRAAATVPPPSGPVRTPGVIPAAPPPRPLATSAPAKPTMPPRSTVPPSPPPGAKPENAKPPLSVRPVAEPGLPTSSRSKAPEDKV